MLAGDTFMPEMNSRQPGFACNAFETFTKQRKNRKYKDPTDSRYIHQK